MRLSRDLRASFGQRELRTFGRKNGYITKGQQERLAYWLPRLQLHKGQRLGQAAFDNPGPVVMEIGFGNGDFLAYLARTQPQWNLLGVEIYLPGIAKAVSRLEQVGAWDRVRISQLPAQYVLSEQVPGDFLHGIYINHPDPWPKPRHAKRRLIQADFAKLLCSRLEPGGFIKLATDWPDLATWMRETLDATPGLANMAGVAGFVPREMHRPHTKFEQRGLGAGRDSQFLHYVRTHP